MSDRIRRVPQQTLDDVRDAWDGLGVAHDMNERNGLIWLNKIVVPEERRNEGVGMQAMRHLTGYADASRQRIALSPSLDFGATSMKRLTDFYRRHGFRPNTGRSRDLSVTASMIREPT